MREKTKEFYVANYDPLCPFIPGNSNAPSNFRLFFTLIFAAGFDFEAESIIGEKRTLGSEEIDILSKF